MADDLDISVVIRTLNEDRWIGHTIQSVLDFIPQPEITIVDNNSNDECALSLNRPLICDKSVLHTTNTFF